MSSTLNRFKPDLLTDEEFKNLKTNAKELIEGCLKSAPRDEEGEPILDGNLADILLVLNGLLTAENLNDATQVLGMSGTTVQVTFSQFMRATNMTSLPQAKNSSF